MQRVTRELFGLILKFYIMFMGMATQIHTIVKIYQTVPLNCIGFIVFLNETGKKRLLIYFIIEK